MVVTFVVSDSETKLIFSGSSARRFMPPKLPCQPSCVRQRPRESIATSFSLPRVSISLSLACFFMKVSRSSMLSGLASAA